MKIHPFAGKVAPKSVLANIPRLVSAYFTHQPDVSEPTQQIAFGTSGHRGSSLKNSFNQDHILAISQALCEYRTAQHINGPLFIGMDTHALSEPALASALEVFAAAGVIVMIPKGLGYTPTPVISHAILTFNQNRRQGLADGVVITPSHNPPEDGGLKYNPPHGGPAGNEITQRIAERANQILGDGSDGIKRMPFEKAIQAATTHEYDYISPYVADLANVVDMQMIAASGLKLGVDPMGGAAVHYWAPIAERYGLSLDIVNPDVDPTFGFMTLDKDGNPHGLLFSLCHAGADQAQGQVRHRLRQRYGWRSPRNRHPKRRTAQSESLSGGGHLVSVSKPSGLESIGRRGQNPGLHLDDRPGGGASGEKAV